MNEFVEPTIEIINEEEYFLKQAEIYNMLAIYRMLQEIESDELLNKHWWLTKLFKWIIMYIQKERGTSLWKN